MYCKKCELEIQGGTETICPLCNTPLEEFPAVEQGAAPDASSEDMKLREMISDIERTITTSLDSDGKSAEPKQEEFTFDLERALSEEVPRNPKPAAPPVSADTAAGDYGEPRAAMEQTPAGIHHAPLPIAEPPRRSAIKNSAALLLILGVVAAGIAVGYLFSVKEPLTLPQAVPAKKMTAPTPVTQLPTETAKPGTSQPQKQEMPVADESKPTAPPAPLSAEPAKESVTAPATVQPVKQELVPPAAGPAKTASEQPPEVATEPPPVQPPEAAHKATEPPPQETAEQPKMAKAAATGFYSVNVGSFKLKASTDRVCRDLKKNGFAPAVETVTLNDGNTWYRVTVGSFATRDEAAVLGRELESKTKIKTMVVKRK